MAMEWEVRSEALLDAEPYELVVPYTTLESALSSVVQVMVAVVAAVLEAIEEMTGAVLSTVTVIEVEGEIAGKVSRATATMDFEPLDEAVLSHVTEYGEEVPAPTSLPVHFERHASNGNVVRRIGGKCYGRSGDRGTIRWCGESG